MSEQALQIDRRAETDREAAVAQRARRELLVQLASEGSAESLKKFAELIATDAPHNVKDALLAFAPLLRPRPDLAVEALFPRLLDAVAHVTVAAIVLDTTNHFVRTGRLRPHPAVDRATKLAELFGQVTVGLEKLAATPPASAEDWQVQRQAAEDGFALLISLCDTLALLGDRSVCDKLRGALDLPHRRLRTEVAAALARLGQTDGIAALSAMAAEPVVRTRAVAYLEELGLADEVPIALRSPVAKAEGVIAQWLAAPLQFGIAPHELALVDERTQFWPGFEKPVECFLFHYAYATPQGEFRGVGIVGPLVHATAADVDDLPPDDIYALFAGFQAEHDQISEKPLAELSGMEQELAARVCREFDGEFRDITLVKIGQFFGERHIVATAVRNGDRGTLVLDANQPHWYRTGDPHRPLRAEEAYQIHKGRKLLAAFNPASASGATK
jgi:hypothetical protein